MPLRLQIIIGSTRPGRFAHKPVAWIVERISERNDFEFSVLDPRDFPLPMYESAVSPIRSQREYPTEGISRLGQTLDWADGYLIVTGEYNHGYPASFKNAMDHVFPQFNRKPVAFVSYGNVGGARAVEQLRMVAVEFEMAPVRHAVLILPELMRPAMFAEEFTRELFAPLDERLEVVINDLLWWTIALKSARHAS